MNVPAALIATAFGATFFVVELTFDFSSSRMFPDPEFLWSRFSTNHAKARKAVSRLLISPESAEFNALRSVEAGSSDYVCGVVKAKDKSGSYAGYHDFVYIVATDSARIDDDGVIAKTHGVFTGCPVVSQEKLSLPKPAIPPDALSMVKNIQKIMPSADSSALSSIASQMPAGASSSGAPLEQQIGRMADNLTRGQTAASYTGSAGASGAAAKSGSTGQQQASSTSKTAALDDENEWRGDRPPAAWPTFPANHPLARPALKRTTDQAMTLAKDVEDRWTQSKSGSSKARPSSDEIHEACRALLAIDPNEKEFTKAWASFVRLQKISREAAS